MGRRMLFPSCLVFLFVTGAVSAQSMVEHAAAAAGGSAGGVAGKKVGDGLSKIFGKVDSQTKAAADKGGSNKSSKTDAAGAPLLQVGPGAPMGRDESGVVPPPPPAHRASVQKQAAPPPPAPEPAPVAAPVAPPPPPPEVTVEDLKKVTEGMKRDDLLKLGPPSARITMFDDGHLVEIYRYMHGDNTIGVIRLTDGAVVSLQLRAAS
jgi:hypothetical protein